MASLTAGSAPVLALAALTPESSSPVIVTSWLLFSLGPPLSVVAPGGAELSVSTALGAFSTEGSKMGVDSDIATDSTIVNELVCWKSN